VSMNPARPIFPKPSTPPQMKRRLYDKLQDAVRIAAWIIAAIILLMVYIRHLGFEVGVNIAAIGLFFLTVAIVFVKASRYAEDAVVVGGAAICFMGMFAFCPTSLMWEWATLVLLLLLIVAIEVFRAIRKAVQAAEKVGDAVIGAVTRIAQHGGESAVHAGSVPVASKRVKIPHGRAEWAVSGLLGLGTFMFAATLRALALARLTHPNVIFMATALIGIGVLGMMAVAFSRSNNAGEDLLAGASVAIGWSGIALAWPHPVWHILTLLVVMSIMAGGTVGPILTRWVREHQYVTTSS
jgi:hypothetical protein